MAFEHFTPTISEVVRYGYEYYVKDERGNYVQNIYTGESDNDKNIEQLIVEDKVVSRYLDNKDFKFYGFRLSVNEPNYKVFMTRPVDVLHATYTLWIELHWAGSELIVEKIVKTDEGEARYILFRGNCKTKYELEWIIRNTFFDFMYLTTLKRHGKHNL